ncbi:hypothetical protein SAMN04487969_115132 [Paenibacillus algorifonticola]|uniref:Uncharacterized protein n=1 Tax=Paenibacillus algorifonticola TaxID=684063 RepID=A0A1I2GF07_9BACL|nr:hypothetical protein [Paenibacillus algorifonticola]SFF15221.1 hypothetical protein SAMN04487969_115132 [Paenibacillus algorifonticola]
MAAASKSGSANLGAGTIDFSQKFGYDGYRYTVSDVTGDGSG